MRPKKVVLLVDCYPVSMSTRKLALDIWGYRVLAAETYAEAVAMAGANLIHVAVVELALAGTDGNVLVRELRSMQPEMMTILISESVRYGERAHDADALLAYGSNSPADLRERIRVMAQRKRGPKPQTVLPIPERAIA